jgi:hypothetical protein
VIRLRRGRLAATRTFRIFIDIILVRRFNDVRFWISSGGNRGAGIPENVIGQHPE